MLSSFDNWTEEIPLRAHRDEEVHGVQPFIQGDVRALENGSGANREIELAALAPIETIGPGDEPIRRLAFRATGAMRPDPRLQIVAGRSLVWEHLEEFGRADRDVVFHALIVPKIPSGVKYISPIFRTANENAAE